MKSIYLLPAVSLFFLSCANQKKPAEPIAPVTKVKKTEEHAIAEQAYKKAAYEDNGVAVPPSDVNLPAHQTTSAANAPVNIPVPSTTAAPAAAPSFTVAGGRTHTVAAGDSLWKIAKQYNVSIDSIKAANGMTKDTAVLGKKLIIPDSAPAAR